MLYNQSTAIAMRCEFNGQLRLAAHIAGALDAAAMRS
jgi:hypothetical protein